jgi:UDP-N-acetylmuramoyl-tripeptide--D-alanyl-D-alanine ligase
MAEWSLTVQEAAAAMDGRLELIGGGGLNDLVFRGVGTDTRVDLQGLLFFALVGDVHDAHDHLKSAIERGATGLVIHRPLSNAERLQINTRVEAAGFPIAIVVVDNTLTALQNLARHWRHKCRAMILGITGTNGKTTTKEFAAAMISTRLKVQWSKGSFNNHWGVPISLLSIAPEHDVAVIEMGMNHPGELKTLSRLADADAVVCTMVGRGHLEGVGSIEGVARAKSEIYEFAPRRSTFVFNLDNPFTKNMLVQFSGPSADGEGRRKLTFGAAEPADVSLKVLKMTPDSLSVSGVIQGVDGQAEIPVFGAHNITNLMAASCLALAAGLSPQEVWAALPLCRSAWGRNQWVRLKSGARCLFDGYNANPESMTAALENARHLKKHFPGKKIAVLGEMRELGEYAGALHEEIGRLVADVGFDRVLFLGPSHESFAKAFLAKGGKSADLTVSAEFGAEAALELGKQLQAEDFVLIKGSRGMSLENFLKALEPVDFQATK